MKYTIITGNACPKQEINPTAGQFAGIYGIIKESNLPYWGDYDDGELVYISIDIHAFILIRELINRGYFDK